MSRDHVNDYTTLRTRPIERPPQQEKPYCTQCGAGLRKANTGTLCAPCEYPEGIEIPEWALVLMEGNPGLAKHIASLVREQARAAVAVGDDQPEPDAPLCACGCGQHTLRAVIPHTGRVGPHLRWIVGHHRKQPREEVNDGT